MTGSDCPILSRVNDWLNGLYQWLAADREQYTGGLRARDRGAMVQQQLLAEESDWSQDSRRLQGKDMLQESAVSVSSEGAEAGMSGLGGT